MKRYKQLVLVLRETVSSYTLTRLIDNERHETLRDAILILCADIKSLGDGGVHIRVDPAPGLTNLNQDPLFKQHGITLIIGHAKNINKNPVAERAIKELGLECLHQSPEGGPLTPLSLALATASMNSRLRKGGLSAREIWTQRDQLSGAQLPLDDRDIIIKQQMDREGNHPLSSRSKSHGKPPQPCLGIKVGDLVFLKADQDKTKPREKYMVVSIDESTCQVRKFTKSQFRSKTYSIHLTDCFPVIPNKLIPNGPIRGLVQPGEADDFVEGCSSDYDDYLPNDVASPNDTTRELGGTTPPPSTEEVQMAPPVVQPTPPAAIISVPCSEPGPPTPSLSESISSPGPDTNLPCDPAPPDSTTDPVPSNRRRSPRTRKPPNWHITGEWDMQ